MAPNPDLITTGEVATILHVTPSTVTRWAKEGKLPSVLLPSGRRKFRRNDVDALLAQPVQDVPA